MTRLVQMEKKGERLVALVEEPKLRVLDGVASVYALAQESMARGGKLSELAQKRATGESLEYEEIYRGDSEWRLLPPIDFPGEPARCLVSGTGLTHLGSARTLVRACLAQTGQCGGRRIAAGGAQGGRHRQGAQAARLARQRLAGTAPARDDDVPPLRAAP